MDLRPPDRRGFLALAAATRTLVTLPAFTAKAAPRGPGRAPVPDSRHQPWRQTPADENSLITEGPPVGNGRLGALIHEASRARRIFQIDANFGTPAAVTEMLLHSRPGHLELLPALPDAWAAAGSPTGAGARGGFVVDLDWRDGRPTEVRIRSIGGTMTSVGYAGTSRTVRVRPGESVTIRDLAR